MIDTLVAAATPDPLSLDAAGLALRYPLGFGPNSYGAIRTGVFSSYLIGMRSRISASGRFGDGRTGAVPGHDADS